jgi:hypothetical protein
MQLGVLQVYVVPAQATQLGSAEPGEDRRQEHRPPMTVEPDDNSTDSAVSLPDRLAKVRNRN